MFGGSRGARLRTEGRSGLGRVADRASSQCGSGGVVALAAAELTRAQAEDRDWARVTA
jgi:hypothetical protein